MKSTCSWPNSRSSRARSAATSVSFRPANRTPQDLLVRRVGGGARRLQPGQLVGVLDRPQHRQALRQRPVASCRAPRPAGRAGASPRRSPRSPWSPSARTRAPALANGSSPSAQSTIARPGAPTAASASGRSRVGTSRVGSRSGVEHEHGQPLGDRCRPVAGEPHQLRSGRDEEPVQPGLGGVGHGAAHPRRVVLAGERDLGRRLARAHRGTPGSGRRRGRQRVGVGGGRGSRVVQRARGRAVPGRSRRPSGRPGS